MRAVISSEGQMQSREWTSYLQRCCNSTNVNARPGGGSPNPTCGVAAPLPSPGHTRRLRGRPGATPRLSHPRRPSAQPGPRPRPRPPRPPPTRSSSGSGSGPGRSARAPQALQARSSRRGPLSAPTSPHLLQHGGPRQPHFREPRQRRSRGPGTRTDEAGSLRAWRSRSNSGNPTPLPLPGPQGRSKWGRGDSEWEDPGGAREWAGRGGARSQDSGWGTGRSKQERKVKDAALGTSWFVAWRCCCRLQSVIPLVWMS